jgi:hypothetical protein
MRNGTLFIQETEKLRIFMPFSSFVVNIYSLRQNKNAKTTAGRYYSRTETPIQQQDVIVHEQKCQYNSRTFLFATSDPKTIAGRFCSQTATSRQQQDVSVREQRPQDDSRTFLFANSDPKTTAGRFCSQTATPRRRQDVFEHEQRHPDGIRRFLSCNLNSESLITNPIILKI